MYFLLRTSEKCERRILVHALYSNTTSLLLIQKQVIPIMKSIL
jgi:hypothetical protein